MGAFIIRRILQTILVLFVLSFVCYYVMSLMPGDPVEIMISSNPRMTSEDVARLRRLYGLDQPAYVRYGNWLKAFVQGDFGYSRTYQKPVEEIIGPRLLNTMILTGLSLFPSFVIGIYFGVKAGLYPSSKFDYIANLFAFGGISLPSFWLAIMLIIGFAVKIKIFPAGGTETIGVEMSGIEAIFDRLKYLVLPTLTLTFIQLGTYARYARSSVIEAMRNDYIRTAKAKGMSRTRVVWIHGFRNALLPLITVIGVSISYLFSGSIITETVFAYQGVGKLVYDSIVANDFNMAMVSFMISIAMVLLMSLVADLLYAVVDPRITYS